jgi:phage baseplate assembly protein W
MRGVNASTGKAIDGLVHLRQSIRDILSTPLGSRVMRRNYGSRLFQLVDAPVNRGTLAEIYAATVDALVTWEPRIAVERVQVDAIKAGRVTLTLTATLVDSGEPITLDGLVV